MDNATDISTQLADFGKDVSTHSLLKGIGFRPEPGSSLDECGKLEFRDENVELTAFQGMNLHFVTVMFIMGSIITERTAHFVEVELAVTVPSAHFGLALMAWQLDRHGRERMNSPQLAAWLEEGRRHFHLLPWNRDMAAFAARPHCSVRRDLARVALRDLAEAVKEIPDGAAVIVEFDGRILRFICNDGIIPVPAVGQAWKERFRIPAANIRRIPKGLSVEVEVAVWKGELQIGSCAYTGATVIEESVQIPRDKALDCMPSSDSAA